jgi:hypothetical protein
MKYARKCTATKVGMNSGWVVNDGEEYYSTERLALKRVKELGYDNLIDAFNDDVCYWTEWEDELDEALNEARETVAALKRVDNDRDFYLLAKGIAKDSISVRWKREAILETVEDVLLSRA